MSDFKCIYQDADISIIERKIYLQDSTDEQRTIILKTKEKEFVFEFVFGKLINAHE